MLASIIVSMRFDFTNFSTNPSPTATVSAGTCSNGAVLLTCSYTPSSGVTLQWKKNNVNITGATNSTYSATSNGTYKCLVTITATGCTKLSNGAKVTITCKSGDVVNDDKLNVYPNPSSGIFTLEISSSENLSIEIRNVIGQVIFSSEEKNIDGNLKKQIDLSGQSSGIYFLEVKSDDHQWVEKILIQ